MKRMMFTGALLMMAVAVTIAQTSKRSIVLDLTLPNGAHPELRIAEGGTGSVVTNVGKFGFVPTLKNGDAGTVVVEVFDLAAMPHRKLATVEAQVGVDSVQTDTTPRFEIRAVRVIAE